jgi:co-chaperonin GroES (HSP10)
MEIKESRTAFADEPEIVEVHPTVHVVPRTFQAPRPPFNQLIIKANATDVVFAGTNFVIPDTAKQKPNRGVVVATSEWFIVNGIKFPMADEVKAGDVVTFGVFNAEDIKIGGEVYVLCSIFDIKFVESVSYAPLG